MPVFSIYVEKKPPFAVEAQSVLGDLKTTLQLPVENVRILNRYLVENIAPADFEGAVHTIFSEPPVDLVYRELPQLPPRTFAVEYLPGQFDQRADSCAQCISLATGGERPTVHSARIYLLEGDLSDAQFGRVKEHLINPVESREASLTIPETLQMPYDVPPDVAVLKDFRTLGGPGLDGLLASLGLAMDSDDLAFCQAYFREENRDPTMTELRMIDTYWSDHCRHTTFGTEIDRLDIGDEEIRAAAGRYYELRDKLYAGRDKPITLMDLATIGAKALKAEGKMPDLDESEEINACSVRIRVDVDGEDEDWLLMFKNETHNHPTEIEPFGGAATCLGGAIRDPLSGRSYVYQAMRVTGAANPLAPVSETLPGKLPQRKLVQTAAAGYSSYGNQIGLATGLVHEIYHPGYVAKRMEIGAVLGAAPAENVVRERPAPGDLVILLGGKTGRDGCGGATGSSKSHTVESLEECGAEVQKGNPPEERKLQRLFRNPAATRLIKRCNDFGAGGVSVAIGELADGLAIDLDKVPKKYEGLDGTELAISESQERMAVVVAAPDAPAFMALAATENLESTVVAEVTAAPRLSMKWRGKTIVDLSREFLNSNGAAKHAEIEITKPKPWPEYPASVQRGDLTRLLSSLGACSQKGLVERFDGSIGAGSVLMPFGGARQLTLAQAMACKIPVLDGETEACSLMAWGFDPGISSHSPYHGGVFAVVESVARIIAAGGSRARCWLSLQEYFEKLKDDPRRWGKPAAALLGALTAQLDLEVGAIGGKDSMSGSFDELDVPPTLVSFAVSTARAERVISTELKGPGHRLFLVAPQYKGTSPVPDMESLSRTLDQMERWTFEGRILSAWALGQGGTAKALPQMCFGNRVGVRLDSPLTERPMAGSFLVEADELLPGAIAIGETVKDYRLTLSSGETIDLNDLEAAWLGTLEPVFPLEAAGQGKESYPPITGISVPKRRAKRQFAAPKAVIPVFPGTNCEYDTARMFRLSGAEPEILVIRNRTPGDIAESVEAMAKAINESQIIAIPGGFSGGDEPEGSAKFITAFFRNPRITEAVRKLMQSGDGLMLGICNGFQALLKLGLLTTGDICDQDEGSPTLTFNQIGRHQSMMVRTRVASNRSPWLSRTRIGEEFVVPVSHGEGRFIASEDVLAHLISHAQIATQYVNDSGQATDDIRYNPNGSVLAIEGIVSPNGRVFGKMAHNERHGEFLYRNIPGAEKRMDIFGGAVDYYK